MYFILMKEFSGYVKKRTGTKRIGPSNIGETPALLLPMHLCNIRQILNLQTQWFQMVHETQGR